MGAFPALPLGRRQVRSRILVVYRLDPRAVEACLPDGLRPRVLQGFAIACACYTRLGSTPLFRGRDSGSDHLAYRFEAVRADGSPATWVARRETSSWLEARCGSKLLRGEYGRSAFHLKEDAFALELAVEGERGQEFYLRGEAAGSTLNALFPSPQALESFLGAASAVQPHDYFAPEADELDLEKSFAPEPLAVFEVRSAFLAGLARGPVELDSAWRLVTRRTEVAPERRPAFRVLPERGASALPT